MDASNNYALEQSRAMLQNSLRCLRGQNRNDQLINLLLDMNAAGALVVRHKAGSAQEPCWVATKEADHALPTVSSSLRTIYMLISSSPSWTERSRSVFVINPKDTSGGNSMQPVKLGSGKPIDAHEPCVELASPTSHQRVQGPQWGDQYIHRTASRNQCAENFHAAAKLQ